MRQITTEAVNAFVNGRSFKKDIVRVKVNNLNISLYVADNMIAEKHKNRMCIIRINYKSIFMNNSIKNIIKVLQRDIFNHYRLPKREKNCVLIINECMRAITKESVNAFTNGYEFKKSNMRVDGHYRYADLYLHDNMIASINRNILTISDCGWKTNTTKERLNGVLDAYNLPRISQKAGVWYIGNEEFNGCKTFEI